MPLIILGLIVVLGAALLIYYQLGPKVTLRLKNRRGAFGSGYEDDMPVGDMDMDDEDGMGSDMGARENRDDGKVLFIFGDGESEERPIREDEEKDEE
jgi:hypothetical protein